MGLENIIQKASDFWNENKTIIRTISYNALITTVIADFYITEIHPTIKKKLLNEPSKEQYQLKYIPDYSYSTNGKIGYIIAEDKNTHETHIVFDRRPIVNRVPWYIGAGILLLGLNNGGIKKTAKQFTQGWRHATTEQKRTIAITTISTTAIALGWGYYYMQSYNGIFDRMFGVIVITATPFYTYMFSTQKANKQRYTRALETNDYESIDYLHGKNGELKKSIKKNLKKGNLSYAIKDTITLTKLYQKIVKDEETLEISSFSCTENLNNLIQRIRTRISPTRKNNLRLILEDIFSDTNYVYNDIEWMIKNDNDNSLEYSMYGYELSTTSEEQKKNAERIIRIANKQKSIIRWNTHSKNPLYYITLPEVEKTYILKTGEGHELQDEARQTNYFKEKIKIPGFIIPDISIIQADELATTEKKLYILSEFIDGINGQDYFLQLQQIIKGKNSTILEKICRMQVCFAQHGIDTTTVDRVKKAMHDYQQLQEIIPNHNEHVNCIEILLKNDHHFPFVYDRDGHLSNYILGSHGEVACIDLEARPQSDSTYMLVKLLDDAPIIGEKKEGIELRNRLLQIHNDALGINSDESYCEPHYYSSIVIKALGYLTFSSQLTYHPIIEEKRTHHLQKAAWAIDVLTNLYESHYSKAELSELTHFKERLQIMPLIISSKQL